MFAGKAVTVNPEGLKMVVQQPHQATSHKRQLRIQWTDSHIQRPTAIQVALHPIRRDPLGFHCFQLPQSTGEM